MDFEQARIFLQSNHRGVVTTFQRNGAAQSSIVVCGAYQDYLALVSVRGKSAKVIVKYPDGREEVALSVPNYDFEWQLNYQLEEPMFLPAGSELQTVLTYDNSTNNRHNPDPTATVGWGDQTWEEMMLGYYGTVAAPGDNTTAGQQ